MRTPITLKIKFKSANLDQFIERYSVDVSRGGIFIRTKEPLAIGTQLRFEFQLQDASQLISGDGTVAWIRENDPSRAGVAPGMGVRFDNLHGQSQNVLERILAEKGKRGDVPIESRFESGARASAAASGVVPASAAPRPPTPIPPPPMRPPSAPSLARPASDYGSDGNRDTPLPPPRPGLGARPAERSAEEEFGQESTRVMQDDIVQALADRTRARAASSSAFQEEPTRQASSEEILARASDSVHVSTAAPTAPMATSPSGSTTVTPPPTPMVAPTTDVATGPAVPSGSVEVKFDAKTEINDLPLAPDDEENTDRVRQRQQAAEAVPMPTPSIPPQAARKSSWAPTLLLLCVAGAGGGWYWMNGGTLQSHPTPGGGIITPSTGTAMTPTPSSPSSLIAGGEKPAQDVAPAAPAPSAVEAAPAPAMTVESTPPGAHVFVDGTAREGVTPVKLTGLDEYKTYDFKVTLKGYAEWHKKTHWKAGESLVAPLVENEKQVEVTSTPGGAEVLLDGKKVGRTPFTIRKVDLSKAHALEVKRSGWKAATRTVQSTDSFESRGARDVLAVAFTLEAEPKAAKSAAKAASSKAATKVEPAGGADERSKGEEGGEKPALEPEKTDKVEKAAAPSDKADKADKADKTDKTDKTDKPAEKTDKPAEEKAAEPASP